MSMWNDAGEEFYQDFHKELKEPEKMDYIVKISILCIALYILYKLIK